MVNYTIHGKKAIRNLMASSLITLIAYRAVKS